MSELERIRRRYEAHHRDRRQAGEFVFVPERAGAQHYLPRTGHGLRRAALRMSFRAR